MERAWARGAAAATGAAMLLLAGCGVPSDYSEIVTFTDEHGRVCTGAVVVDREQNEGDDLQISSLDCEYPPEGQEPGRSGYSPLPERPAEN